MATDVENITLGSFGQGNFVNVTYTAPTDASRIILNLLSDQNSNIHINPRYDEKVLVLNNKTGGSYDKEERPPGFPLTPGQAIQLTVEAGSKAFGIYANKTEFAYQYTYRHDVTEVEQVQAIGNGTKLETSVGKVLPNYSVGKVVYISGRAPTDGKIGISFIPSLPSNYKSETIAFRMGIRFNTNVFVRNTLTNNVWGQEERAGGFPFTAGADFTLIVVAQSEGFEVAVNGSHFTQYKHRLSLSSEMSVQVSGVPHLDKLEYF